MKGFVTVLLCMTALCTGLRAPPALAAADLNLVCLTEQPAIAEGQQVSLRAWLSTPTGQPVSDVSYHWDADTGRIQAQTATTGWDLSHVSADPANGRIATATVTARRDGTPDLTCRVQVYIEHVDSQSRSGNFEASVPAMPYAGMDRISSWSFLLRGLNETPGYGLYSYMLFSAPPANDTERQRYLSALSATTSALQKVDSYLRMHVPPAQLNVIYIPLVKMPARGGNFAQNVLDVYDYARATLILAQLRHPRQNGPYLLSMGRPFSQPGAGSLLWEDLTGVVPDQAREWISFFDYLTAQQHSWSDVALRRFALNLRNVLAISGKLAPDVIRSLEVLVRLEKLPAAEDRLR
jgi:hypothetical protein